MSFSCSDFRLLCASFDIRQANDEQAKQQTNSNENILILKQ